MVSVKILSDEYKILFLKLSLYEYVKILEGILVCGKGIILKGWLSFIVWYLKYKKLYIIVVL